MTLKNTLNLNQPSFLSVIMFLLLLPLFSSGCGDSNSSSKTNVVDTEINIDIAPIDLNGNGVTNIGVAPEITLLGEKVITLTVNANYSDAGANAIDELDGDLTTKINVLGKVNTEVEGDYLLRFQVSNSLGNSNEVTRLVRVYSVLPVRQSQRINSSANLQYLEHLPVNYGGDHVKSPLIIFNHGSGATGVGYVQAVECCGLPGVIEKASWDDDLPFVILSPQRTSGLDTNALNDFVDYAIKTYEIDPLRIYMVGWSQGANITARYVVTYPNKIAAFSLLAGGFFQGLPAELCTNINPPMWLFIGNLDSNIINTTGINTLNGFASCNHVEAPKLTRYVNGDHFLSSIWPFLTNEEHTLSSESDDIDLSIFEWFLTFSL